MTLRTLPPPLKVLATCFLLTIGVGYLFAVAYLYLIDVKPHTEHGMSVLQSVIVKYYGKREVSRLESSLEGPMGEYVTRSEKAQIAEWIKRGAAEAEFAEIQPILEQRCASCHRPESGVPIPPLTTYAEVSAHTEVDLGQSIKTLLRVSHIHLFGMSFIFMLTSLVFALSEIPGFVRVALIAVPFMAIWLDIGSWWLTKHQPAFAYIVIGGGMLMGLSLAAQIVISMYEMWLAGPKRDEL